MHGEAMHHHHMYVTGLYAGCLGLLLLVMSILVIRQRLKNGVAIGDGGFSSLTTMIRAHGNLVEYAPIILLLLLLNELSGVPHLYLHSLGGLLLAGRVAHAIGFVQRPDGPSFLRGFGMVSTFLSLLLNALALIVHHVMACMAQGA
jgi:uncharacterized protein